MKFWTLREVFFFYEAPCMCGMHAVEGLIETLILLCFYVGYITLHVSSLGAWKRSAWCVLGPSERKAVYCL